MTPMKTQLPHRRITARILGGLAIALLLNSNPVAQAQPNPDKPDRPRPPLGERPRGEGPGPRFQPAPGAALMERVLTEDQRESLRTIMVSQREEQRGLQEKMRAARKELLQASLADKFDEDLVRTKALAVAKLEAELTVLLAKAMSQVQPPLSDEQIEKILNPPPQDRMQSRDGEPRPAERRGDRPLRGPREGDPARPPRPEPQ